MGDTRSGLIDLMSKPGLHFIKYLLIRHAASIGSWSDFIAMM